jgi:hypothetical protein
MTITTKEGNRLIADFMQLSYDKDKGIWRGVLNDVHPLSYHFSWDWLIPVINKIRALRVRDGILVDGLIAPYMNKLGSLKRALLKCDILKTWEEVVNFIKWYNNKSK